MSKRNETMPFGRQGAERWTRIGDYTGGLEPRMLLEQPVPDLPRSKQKVSRRGLWLPVYLLGLAGVALWSTGGLDDRQSGTAPLSEAQAASPAEPLPLAAKSSKGLVFGLCDRGGGNNCVVDGNSFYLAGKTIRVAGVDAPATHAARCDGEALLGRAAAHRLQTTLNSGTVTITPVGPEHDNNGGSLHEVRVDGRDVGTALIAAGLARPNTSSRFSWCP